jgi:hypothetical protein
MNVISTEDEIFWKEVRQGVDQVSTQMDRQVTIERGTHKATIVKASKSIMIVVDEIEPEQPVLVKP